MNRDANQPRYRSPHAGGWRTVGRLPLLAVLVLLARAAAGAEDHLLNAELALEQRQLLTAAREFTAAAEESPDAEVAERATKYTFGVGFDAEAERCAARWASLSPDNPLPRALLGRLKLRRHDVDGAAADFTVALGTNEPRPDAVYLALAADLATEENARLVTQVLSRLAALDPLAPALQLALGTAALRSGQAELALAAAESAALDDPGWPEPQLLRARALLALGRQGDALAVVHALQAAGKNPAVDLEAARLLADAGDMAAARQALESWVTEYGEQPEVTRTMAFMDLAEGDLDAAERRFDSLGAEAADRGQERFESFYYRAQIEARRGDAAAARELYGRISSGPYLVPAQLSIAETLARANATDEALAGLAQFARDYPTQAYDVLQYRAQLLQAAGRPDDALALYAEALTYKPADISVLVARSTLLERLGRVNDAIDDLAAAVAIAPDDASALNAYGYILTNRTQRAREAWRNVRRAYELEPTNPAIQDSVGWALYKLGRKEEARSHLEEALQRLPDPEIASHLAEVYWKLGERAAARGVLSTALEANPDSEVLQKTAGRLLR